MEENKRPFTDDELVEEVTTEDDAPVEVIYRCKKCGQILDKEAKDCWKCASKEIEAVVEEETKELKKVMLQARIEKLEHEVKSVKRNNDILFLVFLVVVIVLVVMIYTR